MNFDSTKIPKKISNCPIAEAIIELRFDTKFPVEAITGHIFNKFKNENLKLENLPVMQIPQFVRDNDPNLKFAPLYKLVDDEYVFLVGPKSFSISSPKTYMGWEKYSHKINEVFTHLNELAFIEKPIQIGLRYINFFDSINIFDNINMEFSISKNSLIENENVVKTQFEYEEFMCLLQLANNTIKNHKEKGSIIDIGISNQNPQKLTEIADMINSAHLLEKKIFFSILKEEFLETFKPEY